MRGVAESRSGLLSCPMRSRSSWRWAALLGEAMKLPRHLGRHEIRLGGFGHFTGIKCRLALEYRLEQMGGGVVADGTLEETNILGCQGLRRMVRPLDHTVRCRGRNRLASIALG